MRFENESIYFGDIGEIQIPELDMLALARAYSR